MHGKYKKSLQIAIMVIIAVFYFLLVAATENYKKEDDLFPAFSEDQYIVDIELGDELTNDVEISAQGYKITGNDAFVIYNLKIPYGRGIRILFENFFKCPGSIQFFYAKSGYKFSEETSVRVDVDTKQKYVDVPVSLSHVSAIRIDIEMPEDTEFMIAGLQLDVSNLSYMDMLINKYTWIYLGIFVLIISLVYINRKTEYIKDKSCLFVVIIMLLSVVLVVLMSSQSRYDMHPDEYVTKAAIDYYLNHWLPPDIRSADIRHTFSNYGYTRLREWTVYYFLAGKIGLIFKELFHYTYYYRVFNFLLYIIMIGIVIYNIKRESWLIMSVALTPQLWYIFSYATSDAWDFFCSFLLIYQAVAKDSILNKALEDKCSCRRKIMACAIFGILSAFIMMGKKNYYLILLLLFIIFLFKLFRSQKDEQMDLIKKYFLILVFFGGVLLLRYSINLYHYGFNEKAIIPQLREEHAHYAYKGSTPKAEQAIGLLLKSRGITLQEMFHEYGFGIKSYKSFVGLFGYMQYGCSNAYYWIMGCLLTLLLIVVYSFASKKRSVENALEIIFITIIMCLSIIASIYHSWTSDFQPQGRYLFPILICFAYIASKSKPNTIIDKRICIGLVGAIQILACVAFFKYGILAIAL